MSSLRKFCPFLSPIFILFCKFLPVLFISCMLLNLSRFSQLMGSFHSDHFFCSAEAFSFEVILFVYACYHLLDQWYWILEETSSFMSVFCLYLPQYNLAIKIWYQILRLILIWFLCMILERGLDILLIIYVNNHFCLSLRVCFCAFSDSTPDSSLHIEQHFCVRVKNFFLYSQYPQLGQNSCFILFADLIWGTTDLGKAIYKVLLSWRNIR